MKIEFSKRYNESSSLIEIRYHKKDKFYKEYCKFIKRTYKNIKKLEEIYNNSSQIHYSEINFIEKIKDQLYEKRRLIK